MKLVQMMSDEDVKIYKFADGVVLRFYWRGCLARVFVTEWKFLFLRGYKFSYLRDGSFVSKKSLFFRKLKSVLKEVDIITKNKDGGEV